MKKYLNLRANIALGLIFAFLVNTFGPLPLAQADEFRLPAPGVRVSLSPEYNPPILKGLKVHPDNPFRFDFILDKGDSQSSNDVLKDESSKLIKYFLASLTIPEKDLWVNLSPYEKDRIVPESFGQTEMGLDLLAEDYMLKQITASLIYPEDEIGKKFWKRIYEEAAKKFGTTNIPVNTFNKVWIVPEKAVVYENVKAGTAYVVEAKLKVMLEQDYLALSKNSPLPDPPHKGEGNLGNIFYNSPHKGEGNTNLDSPPLVGGVRGGGINAFGSQIVREIVIPELTKEVNENKNFAQLRQVYNSLILATWYKKKIKDSILAQVYADKNKTAGVQYTSTVIPEPHTVIPAKAGIQNRINSDMDPRFRGDDNKKDDVDLIYQRYLQAFKKGAYNYIKEEIDPITQETIPRKYFSGGFFGAEIDYAMAITDHLDDSAMTGKNEVLIKARFDNAMSIRRHAVDAAVNVTKKGELESLLTRSTGLDLSETIQFSIQAGNEPLIINRDSHQNIQEIGYHERVLTHDEVWRLINDVGLESILSKIKFLPGGRRFKAPFDKVIGQLKTASVEGQPFTVKEVSFSSPVIEPSFANTGTVHARYFVPKDSGGKKLPAVIICSFIEQDPFARLVSTYLVSQGVAVLEVGLPLYGKRSSPGTEGMNTVQRYVKLDFNPEKFKNFIIQSIADTSVAVRWLTNQKEIDGSRISLTGQSVTGAVAMSTYLIDPNVKNIFALVPVVNYAHLFWSKGKRYAPIRELLEQKRITEQDFNIAMEGFNLDQLAATVKAKNNDTVFLGAVKNDELVPWEDTQSLALSLKQPENFLTAYGIPGMDPHLFGSMIAGVSKGFFEKMRDTAIGNLKTGNSLPVNDVAMISSDFKLSVQRELLMKQKVNNYLKQKNIGSADTLNYSQTIQAAAWAIEQTRHIEGEENPVFLDIMKRLLTEDQIEGYKIRFKHFDSIDLVMVLQKMHSIAEKLSVYGVRKETLGNEVLLNRLTTIFAHSNALIYRVLEKAGMMGPNWDVVKLDREILSLLRQGDGQGVFRQIAGKNITEISSQVKAFLEAFDINIQDMESTVLLQLIDSYVNNPIERMTESQQEQALTLIADRFKQYFFNDFITVLSVTRRNSGFVPIKLFSRGVDGIAMKVLLPNGQVRVLKLNIPQNGLSVEAFERNLNDVGINTKKLPGIVRNFGVYSGIILSLSGKKQVVLEFNEFIDGESMRTAISREHMELDKVLDLLLQFIVMHRSLYEEGFINRDARNLNNILVDRQGRAVLVDLGNVMRKELYVHEYRGNDGATPLFKAKQELLVTIIRFLTGVQADRIHYGGDLSGLEDLSESRFVETKHVSLKPIYDLIIKLGPDQKIEIPELCVQLERAIQEIRQKLSVQGNGKMDSSQLAQQPGDRAMKTGLNSGFEDFLVRFLKGRPPFKIADLGSGPTGEFEKNVRKILHKLEIPIASDSIVSIDNGPRKGSNVKYGDVMEPSERATGGLPNGSVDLVTINNIVNLGLISAGLDLLRPAGVLMVTFAESDLQEDSPQIIEKTIDKIKEYGKGNYSWQKVDVPRDYPSSNRQYASYTTMLLVTRDQAMNGEKENIGGIDLTPANMNLQTKMDSELLRVSGMRTRFRGNDNGGFADDNGGIKFHIDPAMLQQLQDAPGFVPVIISVEPVTNLRRFLGIQESAV